MTDKKTRILAYHPSGEGSALIVPFSAEGFLQLQEEIEQGEPGDVWEVRFEEMTTKELNALPEHEGW